MKKNYLIRPPGKIPGKVSGKTPGKIRDKKGQAIVEAVLIMVIFVSIALFVQQRFKGAGSPIKKFVTGPWKVVAGMMESGVWKERLAAKEQHPNHFKRMFSEKGDPL